MQKFNTLSTAIPDYAESSRPADDTASIQSILRKNLLENQPAATKAVEQPAPEQTQGTPERSRGLQSKLADLFEKVNAMQTPQGGDGPSYGG